MVLEARKLSEILRAGDATHLYFPDDEYKRHVIQVLDLTGYDETAKEVYGCTYSEWKRRHQTKATDEQL